MEPIKDQHYYEKIIALKDWQIKILEHELSGIKNSRLWAARNLYRKIIGRKERPKIPMHLIDYEIAGELPVSVKRIGSMEGANLPTVDVIVINYNSKKYINDFLDGISKIDYPADKLHFYIVDNASTDDSKRYLQYKLGGVENVFILESEDNLGFTGGNNIALRLSRSEFKMLLNIDTRIEQGCIKKLVERMQEDEKIGMCEAKQVPHEHPKFFDEKTGETSWCSGACVLLRSEALKQTGLFDERFFLYAEDVDLSWRMWSNGWKCVYEPNAECVHYNFDPEDSKKPKYTEFYYGIRNGIFMRAIYGTLLDYLLYNAKVWQIILVSRHHDKNHKKLVLKLFFVQFLNCLHLLTRRHLYHQSSQYKSPWIKFYGLEYAQHRSLLKISTQI